MEWITTKIRVRYGETDQMGVAYHANYFVWFEVARTEMIRSIGLSYKEMEEQGVLLPVVDASCHYKNSAKYDDELYIKARLMNYNGLRMDFEYEVLSAQDNRLLASGITKHVWIDKNYKPVRLEKIIPEIHQKIMEYTKK